MDSSTMKLENLDSLFPEDFSQEQIAKAKTTFLKKLADLSHRHYGGKIQTAPKAPVPGFNWFNVWYTPGVSKVSTEIRDNNDTS
ncbi:MAG: malate dehydrogenase, partial [Marinilabiliales bacterium]